MFIAIHRRSQKLLACKVTDIGYLRHPNQSRSVCGSQNGDFNSSQDSLKALQQRQRKLREIHILKDLDHVTSLVSSLYSIS